MACRLETSLAAQVALVEAEALKAVDHLSQQKEASLDESTRRPRPRLPQPPHLELRLGIAEKSALIRFLQQGPVPVGARKRPRRTGPLEPPPALATSTAARATPVRSGSGGESADRSPEKEKASLVPAAEVALRTRLLRQIREVTEKLREARAALGSEEAPQAPQASTTTTTTTTTPCPTDRRSEEEVCSTAVPGTDNTALEDATLETAYEFQPDWSPDGEAVPGLP